MSLARSTHSEKVHAEVNQQDQVLLEVPVVVAAEGNSPPYYRTAGLRLHPSHP